MTSRDRLIFCVILCILKQMLSSFWKLCTRSFGLITHSRNISTNILRGRSAMAREFSPSSFNEVRTRPSDSHVLAGKKGKFRCARRVAVRYRGVCNSPCKRLSKIYVVLLIHDFVTFFSPSLSPSLSSHLSSLRGGQKLSIISATLTLWHRGCLHLLL